MNSPEILVVAGEASGDQHAAGVVRELKRLRPELRFFGMGGPRLAAEHVDLLFPASEIAVMGIVEVLPKLRRILHVMRRLEDAAARRKPACALLVDIPDFNLRLAKSLRAQGIPVVYYVSPSVWAWRQGRVDTVAARVNEMLCILPFEPAFYARHGVRAQYVGNPVLDELPAPASKVHFREVLGVDAQRNTLALLPGSRRGELKRILPTMAAAAKQIAQRVPQLQVLVPVAPGRSREELAPMLAGLDVAYFEGRAPEVVGASDVAIVASGTAVLEAGLMERPLVVVYRVASLTYAMAKPLVRVPHYSLVNLLAGKRLVPELIQQDMTVGRIVEEVMRLWPPSLEGDTVIRGLRQVRQTLGDSGAAARAAKAFLPWVSSQR